LCGITLKFFSINKEENFLFSFEEGLNFRRFTTNLIARVPKIIIFVYIRWF